MECRTLEVKIISTKNREGIKLFTNIDIYAVVSISGNPQIQHKTPVDRDGGSNPTRNFSMKFTIDESAAQQNHLTLVFQLRCELSLDNKDIGEVQVPVKELLHLVGDNKPAVQFVTYQVTEPSGKPIGVLNFSYKFGEKFNNAAAVKLKVPDLAPVMGSNLAYPQPPPATCPYPPPPEGYPPSVAGYGYPQPPPPTRPYPPPPEGYPPSVAGYGYPQPPPPTWPYPPPPEGYPPSVAGYWPTWPYPSPEGYPPSAAGYGYPQRPPPTWPYPPPPEIYQQSVAGYGHPPPAPYGVYSSPPPAVGGYGHLHRPDYGYMHHPGYGIMHQPGHGYPPPPVQRPSKLLGLGLGGLINGMLLTDACMIQLGLVMAMGFYFSDPFLIFRWY